MLSNGLGGRMLYFMPILSELNKRGLLDKFKIISWDYRGYTQIRIHMHIHTHTFIIIHSLPLSSSSLSNALHSFECVLINWCVVLCCVLLVCLNHHHHRTLHVYLSAIMQRTALNSCAMLTSHRYTHSSDGQLVRMCIVRMHALNSLFIVQLTVYVCVWLTACVCVCICACAVGRCASRSGTRVSFPERSRSSRPAQRLTRSHTTSCLPTPSSRPMGGSNLSWFLDRCTYKGTVFASVCCTISNQISKEF